MRVYDIVNGRSVRDLGNLDSQSARHRKRTVERRVAATSPASVSLLHEAITDRLARDVVPELERAPTDKLAGREWRSAERKAARGSVGYAAPC